jgi:16S rRNA (adenine1518-N6/adenine1519-N6)-dimethyltransferase
VTHSRREIIELLEAHGLHPSRALGQNFVADANTVRRIARLADVTPGERVVEIGAGLGSLTLALVEAGAQVTAVEIDRHLLPVLRAVTEPHGVRVVEGDAMRLDWADLLAGETVKLVANLPYNVATPLVCDLLDEVPLIADMLVMVQREVGERLAAKVGTDPYGAVSVKVAYWATAKVVGKVPATVFIPQPKVESALVRITRRTEPAIAEPHDRALFFDLVRAGFAHRRKMLRGALRELITDEAVFAAAGVLPTERAEQLDVAAWGRLAIAAQRAAG